jgi:hypothetical protein
MLLLIVSSSNKYYNLLVRADNVVVQENINNKTVHRVPVNVVQ